MQVEPFPVLARTLGREQAVYLGLGFGREVLVGDPADDPVAVLAPAEGGRGQSEERKN